MQFQHTLNFEAGLKVVISPLNLIYDNEIPRAVGNY
jgi:hypothetical protein